DQVEEAQTVTLVALRDRDDEAQVRVDHPFLRLTVAALDLLRELDLLRRGQQRVAPRLVQEELQRVRRRDGEVAVHVRRVGAAADAAVVGERDRTLVQLLVEGLELLALELELLGQLRERREVDATL